eukprot:EW706113.1.p2 GENE.EW706113.1~~EW706113.1.p2  ORF type:complete len:158 (-),score=20.88 EW706113.1:28-501(-)
MSLARDSVLNGPAVHRRTPRAAAAAPLRRPPTAQCLCPGVCVCVGACRYAFLFVANVYFLLLVFPVCPLCRHTPIAAAATAAAAAAAADLRASSSSIPLPPPPHPALPVVCLDTPFASARLRLCLPARPINRPNPMDRSIARSRARPTARLPDCPIN